MAPALIVVTISRRKMDIFAWRIIKDGDSARELRPLDVLKQGLNIVSGFCLLLIL